MDGSVTDENNSNFAETGTFLLFSYSVHQLALDARERQAGAAVAAITGEAKLFGMMADRRYLDHRSGDGSMSPNGRPRVPFDPGMSLEEMEQFFSEML